MIYTVDSLKAILKYPIDIRKWGADTRHVLSIIKLINDASCSSCALRRHLLSLRPILNKYGDDIEYTRDRGHATIPGKKLRIPCTECVAKHLLQAYVLQSEFYQGYIDYLSLIESHLSEALEECPKDHLDMHQVIKVAMQSVVDKAPDVPFIVYTDTGDIKPNPGNVLTTDERLDWDCPYPHMHELKAIDQDTKDRIKSLLYGSILDINLVDRGDKLESIVLSYYIGILAQISEFTAKAAVNLSNALRQLRLGIGSSLKTGAKIDISKINKILTDILDTVTNE